jgi:hypothetical protein
MDSEQAKILSRRQKIQDAVRKFLVYPDESLQFKDVLMANKVRITQSLYWMIEEFKCGFAHDYHTFMQEIFKNERDASNTSSQRLVFNF